MLQKIAAQATTEEGKQTTPVAWDCNCLEEVCGACTMLVNGRTRQACSTLVDRILDDQPGEIELRPMSKFPVLRDLCVDRGRMFRTLEKVKAWIAVDDYSDRGPGPRESPRVAGDALPALRVHDLRLLRRGLPAIRQDRAHAAAKARATRISKPARTPRTTKASSAPRRSAR